MNQCDGCIKNLPLKGDFHYENGVCIMKCQKEKYEFKRYTCAKELHDDILKEDEDIS